MKIVLKSYNLGRALIVHFNVILSLLCIQIYRWRLLFIIPFGIFYSRIDVVIAGEGL